MRMIVLALAALLAAAGVASAQVAAPTLNPVPTVSQGPGNPGVLPWDGPSRIGVSYGDIKAEQPGAPVNPVGKGHETAVQVEYVGSTFAAAARAQEIKLDIDPSLGGGTLRASGSFVGIAGQIGGIAAVGVAQEMEKNNDPSQDSVETLPLIGATVRLGGVFYLGAATGQATVQDHVVSPTDEVKRRVSRMGIGLNWRDKDRGVHLEAYQAQRDAKASTTSTLQARKSEVSGGAVEVLFAKVLVSFEGQTEKTEDAAGAPKDLNKGRTASLGYVPMAGLAVVLSGFSIENSDRTTGTVFVKTKGVTLGAAWLF
jgi:hypothetical protein